jgi:nitrite reductase/ring-hydroxylating ferredoxin subunit
LNSLLKAEHYTQGDAFQAEKHQVFAVAWLPLGAAAQLTAVGDFVSANIGGWPVFAVRGNDGAVRALMNACRHKKMLVVDQAQGRCEFFRCRFHGWTYGLDGRFRDAPLPVAPADPASDEHHLTPLRVEIAQGMVFVNLHAAAASGDYAALAGDSAARDYLGAVTTDIECNWKVLLEQLLAAQPMAAWQWPLTISHTVGEARVIGQIMPRSFLRTRLISHVYGKAGVDRGAALAHVNANANTVKKACETLQLARAAGEIITPENTQIAALHKRLSEAYATHARP